MTRRYQIVERIVSGELVQEMTIEDACQLCGVGTNFYYALIEEGIVRQLDERKLLATEDIVKLRKAARMHLDLEVNLPGIAIILELLDQRQGY